MAQASILQRLRSMSNVAPEGGSDYLARRTSDIHSGMDEMIPDADSADFKMAQAEIQKNLGIGVSRDELRRTPMALLRQKFGLNQQANDAKLREVETEGAADIEQARVGANAAADRLSYTQGQINQRQDANQAAIMDRLERTQSGQDNRQQVAIGAKPKVAPASTNMIARERQALAAAVAKEEPGAIGKFLRRTNPRAAELENFDNTLQWAQKIANEMPEASAEEALAAMGQANVSPEELGQIQKFLLMLKGSY